MNRRNLVSRGLLTALALMLPIAPGPAQQFDMSRKAVVDDPVAPRLRWGRGWTRVRRISRPSSRPSRSRARVACEPAGLARRRQRITAFDPA